MRTTRRTAALALLATAAAFAAGCGGQPGNSTEVRIPLGAGGVGFLPLLVMRDRALIEKHAQAAGLTELTVRWIDLGGPAVMNDALLSGSVDFIAAGPPAFITLWSATRGSADVRGVAAMSSLPMYLNTTNPALISIDDLEETDKIAVTAVKVSIPSINMQMYAAERYGPAEAFRFDRYTVTMTHADAVIALLSGSNQINAHFTSPPFHQREIKDPRVRTVLDTQVNPAIAAHGGMISLVDVQDTEVFVEMSGGCQGCALSRMTLRQGVERMLRQAVPELTAVHDVTDHASGVNPFFQH